MRLAADANVLLSAAIGGRARLILNHSEISEVLTTESTLGEVQEYVASLAHKKNIALDVALLAVATLPIRIVSPTAYKSKLAEARKRMEHRDPDDIHLLALALYYRIPVWSNDSDFEDAKTEWYTTASLLKKLGIGSLNL